MKIMTITSTSDLVAPILQSLAPGMLSVPTPEFIYRLPAERYTKGANEGTTLRFMRPRRLKPPIKALGNSGIEPNPQIPQRDFKDAIMSFYATSVILNEQLLLQNQDSTLAWVSERLAVAGYEAEDIILRDYLMSAAGVYNCRGGANGDNPTNFSERDASNINSSLSTANAFKLTNGKLGENRYGSGPLRAAYIMLSSTEAEPEFDGLEEFKSSWEYPNREDVATSEYGAIRNLRIFTSSEAKIERNASMLGADVFNAITTGKEGYAHIDQDKYSYNLIYRDPIYSGPSALNATLAIKFAQAQLITQETFVRRVRFTLAA